MGAASTSTKNTSPTVTSTQEAVNARAMRAVLPYHRLRIGFTVAVSGVAILAFIIFLIAALDWRNHPFFGAMLNPNMVVDGSTTITEMQWTGLDAGLERLDHVTAINGIALSAAPHDYTEARNHFRSIMSGLKPGDTVEVSFERPASNGEVAINNAETCLPVQNGIAQCRVSYSVENLPDNDFLTSFGIPYVIGLITVIIGLFVFYLRPNQSSARLLTVYCLTQGLFMGGAFDINNTYVLTPLWILATLFIAAPLATLALVFPVKVTALYRWPRLIFVPTLVNALVALACLVIYINPPTPQSFPFSFQPGLFLAVASAAFLFYNLLRRRVRATSPMIRDQSNTVLIGMALTIAPILFWVINTVTQALTGSTPLVFNTSAIMPFFLMPPITMAYAVLQYRTLDTDRVISRGITYGLLLISLVLGYFLLVFGASLIARTALQMRANDPFLIALTIFIIAVLFLPIRTFLQRRIDQIYFRTRSNYQEKVETFARTLTTLVEFDQIVTAFRRQLDDTINPSRVFIFLPSRQMSDYVAYGKPKPETDVHFAPTSPLIAMLKGLEENSDYIYLEPGHPWPAELIPERSRLNILKTLVIARLRGRKELVGFVCIAAPRSDTGTYPFEELRFIQNITNQMALAVERAQVVESLERRVRELDVLSQVSQAVNFTIEFDDLLELINAQTDKLLEAPNFYIVLRERGTDKVSFAFFLEDYERYRDKENRRWMMGRDLFSEVVRTGLPLRVDDYAAQMAERHSPIIYEDTNLKAWMGVPLIAGNNTLGLLAVGISEAGKTYNDDQLKIFGDIGSLAATSLDKARLFAETNLRARQLSALNDISQKLASELNVENLLELITESAVEILDAEAGSLLLMVEDNTELEFRVAVGGSGQDLVGKRFPAKRGLVGEVATTSKPVIVNDAANDPRWGGEITKGAFSTSAVLAVPLMAQNRVIGVLEVLNRKGGGAYIKEDADLLTTFAGQAAIAIENARLFQMTDLQLNARVKELETLEKIDVELNRSLDLKKVADITMRWAIANSGATAGVLGLVIGEAPSQHLQIVSTYGYDSEDQPEGAEGSLWPLERGIVSRVIRTKQPDLATDVRIDPNYIPSLRGSLSQITIPMLSGGEINAILVLEKDTEPRLNLLDLAFATRLAEHSSIAITNAQFYAELTRANESKSEFVSFVAHELKTPMTSMKGFTDLLLGGVAGKLSDQQSTFLSTIRSNIDRMNTLVSDLNDVTKLQTNNLRMEFSAVDFRNIVTETLRPLTKQIEDKGQSLVMNLPKDMPNIMADQNRLIQVLTNMVSNAYKYTPPDGDIYINAEVMEHQKDAKGRDMGPVLHVSVQDTGIGMSEEDLSKLFTPYFRSENPLTREQPGTGLGLTITRGIVSGHGGNIWVESELSKGTTFHFTVPLAAEEPEEEEPESDTQPVK
jgi:signal transduction histidine kinase